MIKEMKIKDMMTGNLIKIQKINTKMRGVIMIENMIIEIKIKKVEADQEKNKT